jgi:hypothetical protein
MPIRNPARPALRTAAMVLRVAGNFPVRLERVQGALGNAAVYLAIPEVTHALIALRQDRALEREPFPVQVLD